MYLQYYSQGIQKIPKASNIFSKKNFEIQKVSDKFLL